MHLLFNSSSRRQHHLGLVTALLLMGPSAWANDALRVTTTADVFDGQCNSHCSLRDAVHVANLQPRADLVLLQAGDYVLSRTAEADGLAEEDESLTGDLDITDMTVIRGRGESSRILGSGADRLLEVLPGAALSLLRLSLEGGYAINGNGGAVENHGYLLLREVQLRNNRAGADFTPQPVGEAYRRAQGGAVANYGQLDVHHSTFESNSAYGAGSNENLGRGGAIFNQGGALLVRDSQFSRNYAGDDGDYGYGGGLYNSGVADVARSLFANSGCNEYGGGGGVANLENGVLTLSNSTLTSNNYGGLLNGLRSTTPAANMAAARLVNVSIVNNNEFGLANWGDVLVRNSLAVGSRDPVRIELITNCRTSSQGRYRAIGFLMEVATGSSQSCTADLYIDPALTESTLIHPLAENGGATQTHALRAGSLALDAGIGSCSSHDQRTVARPQDGNGDGVALCDLGAFEGYLP